MQTQPGIAGGIAAGLIILLWFECDLKITASRCHVAVTVRLDPDRYKRLITCGARFAPRRKNQEIFVEALDAYLEKVE